MGLIAEALTRLLPERKLQAVSASIPTWQDGVPQFPEHSYQRFAKDGYSKNELVYAAVEELATSAAEPRFAAFRRGQGDPEQIDRAAVLDLLERPNPFCDRYAFVAGIIMHRAIAGNAYVEKVRSRAGKVVELWLLRPDRVKVIPDRQRYVGAYEYRIGDHVDIVDARDIIHLKTRNPLDDFYGLPPLATVAERVDVDAWMRQFAAAFFRNAGVPAGILNIQKQVDADERKMIQDRFKNQYGGTQGWHQLMVIDNTIAKFEPAGLPLGERGLVMPDLTEINEARIVAAFGVPLSLIGTRLGMQQKYSNMQELRASFWDETLRPLYQEIASGLSAGLLPDFDGWDYLDFDLSRVGALQEDEDAKHKRIREDVNGGLLSLEEGREALGYDPEPDPAHHWVRATSVTIEPVTPEEPEEGTEPVEPDAVIAGIEEAEKLLDAGKRALRRKAVEKFVPLGADGLVMPHPAVTIEDADLDRALELWDRERPAQRGLLDAAVNGRNGHV